MESSIGFSMSSEVSQNTAAVGRTSAGFELVWYWIIGIFGVWDMIYR